LRRHHDDRTADAVSDHPPGNGLRQKVRRPHVDTHDPIVVGGARLDETAWTIAAGVVDQNVEALDFLDGTRRRVDICHIEALGAGSSARLDDRRCHGLNLWVIARRDDDVRARFGKGRSGSDTDAATAASHQSAASVQAH
jgi:hypothetical protein